MHSHKAKEERDIPEVKTAIILSDDKYIAIYHPSTKHRTVLRSSNEKLSFLVKSIPHVEARAFPLALFCF